MPGPIEDGEHELLTINRTKRSIFASVAPHQAREGEGTWVFYSGEAIRRFGEENRGHFLPRNLLICVLSLQFQLLFQCLLLAQQTGSKSASPGIKWDALEVLGTPFGFAYRKRP